MGSGGGTPDGEADCRDCVRGASQCLPRASGPGNLGPRNGKRPAVKGFISYTHTDYPLCREFESHLALSRDHGGAEFWADKRITAGEHWSVAIEHAIDQSEIFLLLVSAKFLGSAYVMDVELPRIMARAARCDGLVVPVILRRCSWRFKFGGYQAVPIVSGRFRPICNWRPRNDGFDMAHEQVLAAIQSRTARLVGQPGSGTP
jgi:TIR domain